MSELFRMRLETTLSPAEAIKKMVLFPESLCVVDVRNGHPEVLRERVRGALWIPEKEIGDRYVELPTDRLIVLCGWDSWCNLAARSALVLIAHGLSVKELVGGMAGWTAMGLPTESFVGQTKARPRD